MHHCSVCGEPFRAWDVSPSTGLCYTCYRSQTVSLGKHVIGEIVKHWKEEVQMEDHGRCSPLNPVPICKHKLRGWSIEDLTFGQLLSLYDSADEQIQNAIRHRLSVENVLNESGILEPNTSGTWTIVDHTTWIQCPRCSHGQQQADIPVCEKCGWSEGSSDEE